MSETIKALIGWSGDHTVGIPDGCAEADTGIYDFNDEGDRDEARRRFKELYDWLSGEKCGVRFSDECADCGIVGDHECSALPW